MKAVFFTLALMVAGICSGQTKKVMADSSRFNKLLRENTTSFIFNGQEPSGEGWTLLEKQFAQNQFVGWGEYHNSALFSQLSTFALAAASKYGFKNWCVEVSPFVASELTRISKSGNPFSELTEVSKNHPNYGTFPFFNTKEDAQMLSAAERYKLAIWGVDQEFQLAFPYCIDNVYKKQSPKIIKEYKGVYDSLMKVWWMPDVKLLDSLKKVVLPAHLKVALEDIKISRMIYAKSDNALRAILMKRNFYNYYDNTKFKDEKVFFKLGANHLAKGLNLTTHLYDLGNAAYELSQRNKTNFTNCYFIVRYTTDEGKIIDDLENEDNEYPKEFLKLYHKDKWVVVDLRPFRVYYHNDKTLTEDTYKIIDQYDFIIVSPEVLK